MEHNKSFCREKYGKKYRDLTLEEQREYNKIRKQLERETHPERLGTSRQYGKTYYSLHRETILNRGKEYCKANKDKLLEYKKRYRDQKRGCPAGHNSKIFKKYGKRFKDMTIEEKRQVKRDYATQHRYNTRRINDN